MKRHSLLLAASVMALAACSSTPTETAAAPSDPPAAAAAPGAAPAAVSAGKQVYASFCAACHNGGDETAPVLEELHALGRERIMTAISPGGLMALQGQMLNAEQLAHVVSFLAAAPDDLARLAAAEASADPTGQNRAAYIPGYDYPARRVRAERDTADVARAPAWSAPPLGDGPFEYETWEQRKLKVEVLAKGLSAPRAIEFLPNGDLLVAERTGVLRIIRNGKLDPAPVAGVPKVAVLGTATGFMDVKLHPDFTRNGLIYLAYHKPALGEYSHNTILRGRWDGEKIVDAKEIFVSDDVDALYSKMMFGPDGKLYVTIGCPGVGTDDSIGRAQDPGDYAGKVLRLNDDGTIPRDNPFISRKGYNPEIFTLGHRVNLGIALNPSTNEFWVSEHGPQGGDEVNVLRAGQNYGWPLVSDGRYYAGQKVSTVPYKEGMTRPHISYVPSIAPGGMAFYTGDKFPAWKGNLFLGAMRMSNAPRTGHLERIVLNKDGDVVRSEMLLFDLHQRIRDVEQGADGYLYVMTDEGADSAIMRLSPG